MALNRPIHRKIYHCDIYHGRDVRAGMERSVKSVLTDWFAVITGKAKDRKKSDLLD